MNLLVFAVVAAGTIAAWAMLLLSLLGLLVLVTFLVQHGPEQPRRWASEPPETENR